MTRVTGGFIMTYVAPVLDTTLTISDGVRLVAVTDSGQVYFR
jgi:hypothetical protein